ncbi:ABC transporter ATP-binding protein [Corallincola spongiicola]|uniref:ABC transporter ATP-binding protein n=1 Tax=Corallincola spongiicola TaxID=2520508 RepID=A0ABY1WRS7_9GAMM|nr:ABC transporter ATP-binding protein [Corallincola spongiicola]TAA47283.1 ABC transporter ATP-binding protein [Corallincola spongiicola]
MANQEQPLVQVDALGWQADGRDILQQIDFQISRGTFVGLIGPNGAGKSSLLRCLYRVNKPSSGQVRLNGQNLWQHSARTVAQQVAVVLQETTGNFGLRLRDVVRMGLTPHKAAFALDSHHDLQLVDDAIEQVGLTALAQQPFEHLSGGEKQRALIARAIVQRPKLLLMDEPTNHLDVRYQIQVLELAKHLGITVIASIHDLNLASAFCDQLLLIDQGKLIGQGTPDEILTERMLGEVFGVCSSIDQHPDHGHPRITYHYGYLTANNKPPGGDHA